MGVVYSLTKMLRLTLISILCMVIIVVGVYPNIQYPPPIVKSMTSNCSRFIVFGGLYIVLLADTMVGTLLGIVLVLLDSTIQNIISIGKRY